MKKSRDQTLIKQAQLSLIAQAPIPPITRTPVPGQQFSWEQIVFVVRHLLLQASTGFRAASRVIQAVAIFFGIPWEVHDHTTERSWLLRISLYQLQRPKQKAGD